MTSPIRKDLTGQIHGELTVLEYVRTVHKRSVWKCKCSCGRTVEKPSHMLHPKANCGAKGRHNDPGQRFRSEVLTPDEETKLSRILAHRDTPSQRREAIDMIIREREFGSTLME